MRAFLLTIFCVLNLSLFAEGEKSGIRNQAEETAITITRRGEWKGDEMQQVLSIQDTIRELKIVGLGTGTTSLVFADQLFGGSFPELRTLKLFEFTTLKIEITSSFAPHLEAFELIRPSHAFQTNSILGIENFSKLKRLVLARMVSEDIRGLDGATFPYLEELNLNGGFFNQLISISTLAPNLKSLSLSGLSLFYPARADDFFSSVSALDQLESLDLSYYHRDLPDLNFLPNALKELSLAGNNLRGVDFSYFSRLEALNLARVGLDFDLQKFATLEFLKKLDLSNNHFSSENIEQMQSVSLTTLEELTIDGSNIRGAKLATFAPNLKRLSLNDSNITGGDIAEIARLKNLEFLDIGSKSLTGAILKKIAKLQSLKELSLANTNMSKADFNQLPRSIEVLNLYESSLSVESFNTLHSLTQLRKLDLRGIINANITPEMIDTLQKGLPDCEILRR